MATLTPQGARSAQLRQNAERELKKRVGLVRGPYDTYSPNVMDPLGMSHPNLRQEGALNLMRGVAPSDADVTQFLDGLGLLPKTAPGAVARAGGGGNGRSRGLREQVAPQNQNAGPLGDLSDPLALASAIAFLQDLNAKNANLDRYRKLVGENEDGSGGLFGDLAKRNQGRVENWGKVQEQLNEERFNHALGDQLADLASRGMANSTIAPNLKARNARDLALVQQDVSERRDDRAMRYDTADTERIGGVIERRNDTGPDLGMLLQLAQQMGRYGDRAGGAASEPEPVFRSTTRTQQSSGNRPRSPFLGAFTPPGPVGGVLPMWLNGTPMQQANASGLLNNFSTFGPNTSNRYPTRRPPKEAAPKTLPLPIQTLTPREKALRAQKRPELDQDYTNTRPATPFTFDALRRAFLGF